jgi:hypothetical protein
MGLLNPLGPSKAFVLGPIGWAPGSAGYSSKNRSPVTTPVTGGPQSAPLPASPIPQNTNVEWRTPWPLSATSPSNTLTSGSPPPAPVLSASPPCAPALPVTNYLCSLLLIPHGSFSSHGPLTHFFCYFLQGFMLSPAMTSGSAPTSWSTARPGRS